MFNVLEFGLMLFDVETEVGLVGEIMMENFCIWVKEADPAVVVAGVSIGRFCESNKCVR